MNTFNQIEYQNQYNKEKYDRITIMVPKGNKDVLQAYARKLNISLNAFMNQLIEDSVAFEKQDLESANKSE